MDEKMDRKIAGRQHCPSHYPVCIHTECPLAGNCLRGIQYRVHAGDTYITQINESQPHAVGEGCPHYRTSEPHQYAYGCKAAYEAIYPESLRVQFRQRCMHRLGLSRSAFYYLVSGTSIITPHAQQTMLAIARELGIRCFTESAFEHTFLAPDW